MAINIMFWKAPVDQDSPVIVQIGESASAMVGSAQLNWSEECVYSDRSFKYWGGAIEMALALGLSTKLFGLVTYVLLTFQYSQLTFKTFS